MPAGMDFVCENQECEQCGKGIVITAPWPMGDINIIIDAPNVAKNKEFRERILTLKTEGRKYACITYPNINGIEQIAFRIHLWCPNCPCLWTYDAPSGDLSKSLSEIIDEAGIPDKCIKCESYLMDFNDVVEESVICPFCNEKMTKNAWFCNETTEEIR